MKSWFVASIAAAIGCSGPNFTHLGGGVGVPSEVIDQYAEQHDVSRQEARARLAAQAKQRRIERHANEFGASPADAERRREHSATLNN